MQKHNQPIVTFNPTLAMLSANEQEVLTLLYEAVKLVVPIYELQENHDFPGANFYPKGIKKEEIERAAKKNPEILSPYTVVEKLGNKLVATPYHVKYAKLLKPITDKLNEASEITTNLEFAKCLKIQSEALLTGKYDKAILAWMKMTPYIIDINIGPVERYDDRLFFTKASYQGWLGVMDRTSTDRVNEYKDVILSARREAMMPSEKVDYYDKVQIRVDDTIIFTGLIARTLFIGVNLPNDVELMQKYGSEITIFKQTNDYRFQKYVWPTFNKFFSSEFKKSFNENNLKNGHLYSIILHELAHTYLRYRHSEKNLQDLFPIVDELSANVMGIKVCGSLMLKDMLNQKQLESIMLAFTSRNFNLVLHEKDEKSKYHYVVGSAIYLNYLFENGALKELNGVYWPNFTKMFFSISELATVLERMLSQGTRKDAEEFIKKYGNIEKLQRFANS